MQNEQAQQWNADTVRAAIDDGCPDAWTVVIDRTRGYLMRVLQAEGANWYDAEDLMQLTYCRAWERRAQFARSTNWNTKALLAWLTTTALNAWRDLLRRRSHLGQRGNPRMARVNHCDLLPMQIYQYESVPSDDPTPEDEYLDAEYTDWAHATLARLVAGIPAAHQPFVSYLLDDSRERHHGGMARVDIERVQRETGLTYGGAKSACHRTRESLRAEARRLGLAS